MVNYFVLNRSIFTHPNKFLCPAGFSLTTTKKIAFFASIVLLVLSLVTCNFGQSASDLPVEYTDVVYSADGTQVTLYLDGVGVPVTQSQRALTTKMAKMAHDFYEVVFWAKVGTDDIVTRATWEIGQSAGISGLYKGTNPTAGIMYAPIALPPISGFYGLTCLFAGRKADKVLLAFGYMTHVDGSTSNPPWPTISSSTKSVTFTVDAIKTKLYLDDNLVVDEDGDTWSFPSFVTASGDAPFYSNTNLANTKGDNNEWAEYVSLGGVQYPYYKLPKTDDPVRARYLFFRQTTYYNLGHIRLINDGPIRTEAIIREPRFLAGGRYYYVQAAKIDTGTKIDFITSFFTDGNNAELVLQTTGIHFIFDTSNSQGGIFSFTFRIPVYNLTRDTSVDGTGFTTWYVQPGFGKDLYSLDDGKYGSGGCILMGTEDFGGEMIDIFTDDMPW